MPDSTGHSNTLARLHHVGTPSDWRFDSIAEAACRHFDAAGVVIAFPSPEGLFIKSQVWRDTRPLAWPQEICSTVVRDSFSVSIPDLDHNACYNCTPTPGERSARSLLAVPIAQIDGMTVGALIVLDNKPRLHDEDNLSDTGIYGRMVTAFIDSGLRSARSKRRVEPDDAAAAQGNPLAAIIEKSFNEILMVEERSLKVVHANEAARKNLGYTDDDLKGMNLLEILSDFDRTAFRALISPLKNGGTDDLAFETVHRRKDGETYPVEVRIGKHYQGRVPELFILSLDITDRQALARQRDATRSLKGGIMKSSSNGVLTLERINIPRAEAPDQDDIDFKVLYANSAAERILRHSKADMLGKNLCLLFPIARTSRVFTRFARSAEIGLPETFEQPLDIDGTRVWLSIKIHEIADGRLSVTFSDITGIKNMETALQKSNEALFQFTAIASHDLQAPIRQLNMFAHFIKEDCGTDLDAKAHAYLDKIIGCAARTRGIVANLLEFSRSSTTGLSLVPVDLSRVVQQARAALEDNMNSAKYDLEVHMGDLPTVLGHADLLERLFVNLMSNTVKFNHNGKPEIWVRATCTKDQARIEFEDNGPGIPSGESDLVFAMYGRAKADAKGPTGNGIGLSLCRHIAESHGGNLTLDSSFKGGARFVLVLDRPGYELGDVEAS